MHGYINLKNVRMKSMEHFIHEAPGVWIAVVGWCCSRFMFIW